jgi:hypothetical protein
MTCDTCNAAPATHTVEVCERLAPKKYAAAVVTRRCQPCAAAALVFASDAANVPLVTVTAGVA